MGAYGTEVAIWLRLRLPIKVSASGYASFGTLSTQGTRIILSMTAVSLDSSPHFLHHGSLQRFIYSIIYSTYLT